MPINSPARSLPGSLVIDGDPVSWERTPRVVADRLRELRRERADAQAAWRGLNDERQAAVATITECEIRLRTLLGARRDSEWFTPFTDTAPVSDDHPDVQSNLRRLEIAKGERARIDPLLAARAHEREQIGLLVESVERYLRERLGNIEMKLYDEGPEPSLRKRETPLDAVERCRQRVRGLTADRHRVQSAPWHSGQAKHRARAEIEKLAASGEPRVSLLLERPDGAIAWRERPIWDHMVAGRLITTQGDPAPLPLLSWLLKDVLIQKLEQAIDEAADDQNSLTLEERREQIQTIDRDLLGAEREEDYWLLAARVSGAKLLRRSNLDPRVVLGLGDDLPPP
jgi:hypothetical protein